MDSAISDLLRQQRLTLARILEASPWHPLRNLNGLLDEGTFYDGGFFVSAPHLGDAARRLKDQLDDRLADHVLLILEGFSGTGKTTFLRWFTSPFQNSEGRFIPHWLDLDDLLPLPPRSGERLAPKGGRRAVDPVPPASPITQALREFLWQPEYREHFIESLYVATAQVNSPSLRLSSALEVRLRTLRKDRAALAENRDVLQSLSLRDAFLLMLLSTMGCGGNQHGRRHLFLFDNLDRAGREYLSEPFISEVQSLLVDAARLFQEGALAARGVDFVRDARLIFCLRDPNSAVQDAHLRKNLGTQYAGARYVIRPTPQFVADVLEARLDIADNVLTSASAGSRAGYRQALRALEHDEYFTETLVDLYNRDIKTLMERVVSLLEGEVLVTADDLHCLGETEDLTEKYLLRGQLVFALSRRLRDDDFVQALLTIKTDVDEANGYCLLKRMIMTWLSNCRTFDPQFHVRGDVPEADGNLFDLLDDFFGIYPLSDVIHELSECFLYHQSAWVHPITIVGVPLTSLHSLDWADTLVRPADESPANLKKPQTLAAHLEGTASQKLREVRIRLNPAGFAYLRYLSPHFEIYNVMAGGEKSLLSTIWSCGIAEGKSTGVEIAKRVLQVVKRHARWNQTFFDKRFRDGAGIDSGAYRGPTSKYSFKWKGRQVRTTGRFHMARVAAAHLDYLDHWRRYVLGLGGADPAFNQQVVALIREYLGVLDALPDDLEKALARELRLRTEVIERSKFVDSTTRVS